MECFFWPGFLSWSIMLKRETLMRRQWKWPVFGWRWVSASSAGTFSLSTFPLVMGCHSSSHSSVCISRKKTWSRSSSRSWHRGSRLGLTVTQGWRASPTERTWTGPRWRYWSTKATPSLHFILWKNQMNSGSSTSCWKATDRRQNTPAEFSWCSARGHDVALAHLR